VISRKLIIIINKQWETTRKKTTRIWKIASPIKMLKITRLMRKQVSWVALEECPELACSEEAATTLARTTQLTESQSILHVAAVFAIALKKTLIISRAVDASQSNAV
jgi:hypothetical protein